MAHSSNSTKVAAAEYVKRKLEFGGPSITRSETESNQASPTLEKAKRRRLYFGESEVPVFLQCLGEFTIVLGNALLNPPIIPISSAFSLDRL